MECVGRAKTHVNFSPTFSAGALFLPPRPSLSFAVLQLFVYWVVVPPPFFSLISRLALRLPLSSNWFWLFSPHRSQSLDDLIGVFFPPTFPPQRTFPPPRLPSFSQYKVSPSPIFGFVVFSSYFPNNYGKVPFPSVPVSAGGGIVTRPPHLFQLFLSTSVWNRAWGPSIPGLPFAQFFLTFAAACDRPVVA